MKIAEDKIKHFAACTVVAFIASTTESLCGAQWYNSFFAGLVAGMAIGVGKEYGDKCAIGNKWDWADIGADACGSVLGAALGSLFSFIAH